MPNVTLAFDESTLDRGRVRARELGKSFNAYVRQLIAEDANMGAPQVQDLFTFMDQHPLSNRDITWTREEIHER